MNTTDILEFPHWYDDLAEFEHMHKGYLNGVVLRRADKLYQLTFYDSARLKQDAEAEFEDQGFWTAPNLILVRSVTRTEITNAVNKLCEGNVESLFVPAVGGEAKPVNR